MAMYTHEEMAAGNVGGVHAQVRLCNGRNQSRGSMKRTQGCIVLEAV